MPGGIEVAVDQDRINRLTQVVQEGLRTKGLITKAQSLAVFQLDCRHCAYSPALRQYDLGNRLLFGRPFKVSTRRPLIRKAQAARQCPSKYDKTPLPVVPALFAGGTWRSQEDETPEGQVGATPMDLENGRIHHRMRRHLIGPAGARRPVVRHTIWTGDARTAGHTSR